MEKTAGVIDPTTIPDQQAGGRRGTGARRARRALVILAALAAALLDWVLWAKIIGADLVVDQGFGPQAVQPVLVAAAPILSGLSAWLLLAFLERFAGRRATTVWRVIAAVVLLGSLWSPITMALSVTAAIALVSMHVVVGAIFIAGLPGRRLGR
jgi:hypothetical protein